MHLTAYYVGYLIPLELPIYLVPSIRIERMTYRLPYQLQLSLPFVCGLDYPLAIAKCFRLPPSSLYTFPLQDLARDRHSPLGP